MENNLVVKANNLVQAKYELNLNEQKILLYAISKLDRNKEKFNIIEFNIKEFNDLLQVKGKRYEELREVVRELRRKEVVIKTDDKELITGWLSSIVFHNNTGRVTLEFDSNLVPYLLQLKEQFTRYQIKNILYLSNKHSIRIYELLKQYETIGKRTFTVKELKEILMLKDQYNRFYDFERYVLRPSMEEINEYTDVNISYEKIKKGRSIESIKYRIEPKKICKYKQYLEENYNIKDIKASAGLEEENFNSEQIIKLYEIAINKLGEDLEDEKDIYSYININYKEMLNKNNIVNRYAYLVDMLEHDRAKAIVYIRECKKGK